MVHEIVQVTHTGGWSLRLRFANGEVRRVDIREFVTLDGVFEPLRDEAYFAQVRVEPDLGTIVWPNGADLCPDVLFEKSRAADADAA